MDLIKHIISFAIFALFVVSFIGFGVTIGTDNEANTIITNDSSLSKLYSEVNKTIYKSENNGSSTYSSFTNTSETTGISSDISEFFMKGILSVGNALMSVSNGIFMVTFEPLLKIIGLPQSIRRVVGIVVGMIILFSLITMAWKLYRVGY